MDRPGQHIHHDRRQPDQGGHYFRLALELVADFIVMYLVMYAMIATLQHFRLNLNNLYMTLMMVAPMSIIMLLSMHSMFPSRLKNVAIIVGAIAVFVVSFVGMRQQLAIGNAEFLRAMIPHHSGAILMCQEASLTDPEIVSLCSNIVESQQREITQMEGILNRL
jgi:hypothetical protein